VADAASGNALFDEVFEDATPHDFIIEITQGEWEGITQDMIDYAQAHPITSTRP
jgi:hypothetical protein